MTKKYKENNLLYFGAGFFFCTTILYIITNIYFEDKIKGLSRLNFNIDFSSLIFLSLFIAPIVEEFIFRSIFLNKKLYQYFFFIGSSIYALTTDNFYLLIIIAAYFIIYNKNKKTSILFYFSASIFTLVHYQLSDFTSIFTVVPMFLQFSLGLILIWVVINFGLMKTILLHFLYNFIIILPLVVALQFPDKKENIVKYGDTVLLWNKTEYFGKTRINVSKEKIEIQRSSIKDFYGIYGNKENLMIDDTLKVYRYNFKVINKNNEKIDSSKIKKLLFNAKLIKKT